MTQNFSSPPVESGSNTGSAWSAPALLPAIAGGEPAFASSERLIFQAPVIGEAEIASVVECLRSRWIGLGPRVAAFEQAFATYKGVPYATAVSSCSAALHLSLLALRIGPGDEVIAPTMTYCATVHAIVHVGAKPVLADCDPTTGNVSSATVAPLITERTKALIVVHMAGQCCAMPELMALARKHNLRVVEDCAHAVETTCDGVAAGTIGDLGCFSFYPTKNMTTGDGGMVITADRRLYRRVKLLSQNGMSADAWSRESRRRVTRILAPGYKYNMTDLEASLGLVQLAEVESRWVVRQHIAALYRERLQHPALRHMARPREGSRHAHHLYRVCLELDQLRATRDEIAAALRAENIGTGVHYVPIHQQAFYRRCLRRRDSELPHATAMGRATLSLPMAADLTDGQLERVIVALGRVLDFYAVG